MLMPMNDRAHMPDPISFHSSSSRGTRFPKMRCSGPCLWERVACRGTEQPSTSVASKAPTSTEAANTRVPPDWQPTFSEMSSSPTSSEWAITMAATSTPSPDWGSMSATLVSAGLFVPAISTSGVSVFVARGSSGGSSAARFLPLNTSLGRIGTCSPGRIGRGSVPGVGNDGPPDPEDPPVIVASAAGVVSSPSFSVLRFFSSASAKMMSERRTAALTHLSSDDLTLSFPASVSDSIRVILSLHSRL